MTIGENIKRLRKERGLTQVTLGERAGLSNGQISEYEHDVVKPPIERLAKIADVLGVSVAAIDSSLLDVPGFCPPVKQKSEDHFLQVILENWPKLDQSERAQVAGLAAQIAEDKKTGIHTDSDSSKIAL